MKLRLYSFTMLVVGVLAVILIFLGYSSVVGCAVFSTLTLLVIVWGEMKTDRYRITFSTALLMFTIVTQFGLFLCYVFLGRDCLSNYHDYTLRFLWSPYLGRVVLYAVLAVSCFEMGKQFSRTKYPLKEGAVYSESKQRVNQHLALFSTLMILLVFLYFVYHILTGGMSLFSTYEQFRESRVSSTSIYSYILILFYVGTIYLAAAGTVRECWFGWTIWFLQVILFAMNGNKGEFLYSMLAVVGMKGLMGKKISFRMILMGVFLLCVLIPSITTLRGIGVAQNLRSISFNPVEAFTEMGMQLRTSVYVLELMDDATTGFLYGRSYWQPLFNLITPFMSHTQATAHIRSTLGGMGFSQVAESYLNFGVLGIVVFFGLIGYFLSKAEAKANNKFIIAYIGTITCILINATRNYFAFVPGHILMVSVVALLVRRISIKKR